jgi:acetylornithine deacetylase/succinyl-diaminopimelate desuccinylase-like protein
VTELTGEAGYSALERVWARPTLEVNGVWGGFQGDGVKTVLPNEAHAKITCRLVPDQAPERILEHVAAHVEKHAPRGVRVSARPLPGSARPYAMPADHPGARAAGEVLTELYGKPPHRIRMGGSVPVCELFLRELGAHTVGFGFALEDERFHAPDEFFRLASFERGQKGYCMLLRRLSGT